MDDSRLVVRLLACQAMPSAATGRYWAPSQAEAPDRSQPRRALLAEHMTRTSMRRYTRLSNGFSRKIENHMAAVAINYFAYNFIKIHRTLRMSPAMAAGVV